MYRYRYRADPFDFYPLHEAVENGDLDLVKSLLRKRAYPNDENMKHFTPLMLAAVEGCPTSILQRLLNAKADPCCRRVRAWL